MQKQILVHDKKRGKKRWLKGCSFGEKFGWLAGDFLAISQVRSWLVKKSFIFKLCSNGLKKSPA